jgi:hypothetical protein
MRSILISLILTLLCACSVGPKYQVQTLPNGMQLKVINVSKVQMATPNGVVRYMRLDYQTDLSISDIDALKNEADQIWPYFKNNVEQAGLSEATIRANTAPTGTIVQKSSSHAFAYKKAANGVWSRAGG